MEMTRFHMEMTSSHVGMTRFHIGMSRRRLSACEKPIAQARSDMGTNETHEAPQQSQ